MNDSHQTDPVAQISQAEVDALLASLKELREQVAAQRAALAPLEAQLCLAQNGYQAALKEVNQEASQLKAELYDLEDQIAHAHAEQGPEIFDVSEQKSSGPTGRMSDQVSLGTPDLEEMEKDMLLEHLVRVLDHMRNVEDAELLSHVQGLVKDPSTRLVDALEQVPWGLVWTRRSRYEDLKAQYRRLKSWEQVLTDQLHLLSGAAERMRQDRRYALYEQYQKGQEAWQQFLKQVVQHQQTKNDALAAEVRQKRAEWAEMAQRQ